MRPIRPTRPSGGAQTAWLTSQIRPASLLLSAPERRAGRPPEEGGQPRLRAVHALNSRATGVRPAAARCPGHPRIQAFIGAASTNSSARSPFAHGSARPGSGRPDGTRPQNPAPARWPWHPPSADPPTAAPPQSPGHPASTAHPARAIGLMGHPPPHDFAAGASLPPRECPPPLGSPIRPGRSPTLSPLSRLSRSPPVRRHLGGPMVR